MSNNTPFGLFIKKSKSDNSAGTASPMAAVSSKPKNVQKNWMYLGLGVVGVLIISTSMFANPPAKREIKKKEDVSAPTINVTPTSQRGQAFEAKYGQNQAMIEQRLEQLAKQQEEKDNKIKELTDLIKSGKLSGQASAPPEGIMAPPVKGDNSGGLDSIGAPPSPPIPKIGVQAGGVSSGARAPQAVPPSLTPFEANPISAEPTSFPAPASEKSSAVSEDAASAINGGVNARVKYSKNKNAGMIPAGSFAPISLLNGIDAGTSDQTRANPVPVLMRVNDYAVLPGTAKYDIRKCFILGSGYGDPSSERVYMRFSRISCTNSKDRLVLSQEVSGYVVDSDGKVGMRGVVTERQGALLYKSTLAGFAQGLTGALGSAQGTVLSNLTTGTTTNTINGTAALRASGLAGAQSAASQLAEFYLKQAQNVFSIITVDAGRLGTIVFTNSSNLTWSDTDSQFVEQVAPTNN